MWRSKRLIIAFMLVVVILVGSISGVVLAAENGDTNRPETKGDTLLDRVCEFYEEKTGVAIDQEALKDAFVQAQGDIRTEAMETRLEYLVDQERITQEQADEYLEWWQAKPDALPGFSLGGHGRIGGMRGMHGFSRSCLPMK